MSDRPSQEYVMPTPGSVFGSYEINAILGEGGYGVVFDAQDRRTGRRVALKVHSAFRSTSPQAIERFKREGQIAASIYHPNSVYLFEADEINGIPIVSMELMPGGTLKDLLEHETPNVQQAVDYIIDIIHGLVAASDQGVIHRDIKPSNCFLDESGNVKIGDFGLSKTLGPQHQAPDTPGTPATSDTPQEVEQAEDFREASLTATGQFIGTPHYMAPEVILGGHATISSDMFSLGATLYELLTGSPPYPGDDVDSVFSRIISSDLTPLSTFKRAIPLKLQKIVVTLLSTDPTDRPTDYRELIHQLLPFSSSASQPASLDRRLGAAILDYILIYIATLLLSAIPYILFYSIINSNAILNEAFITYFTSLLMPIIAIIYYIYYEQIKDESVGKRIFKIQIKSIDQDIVSPSARLKRIFYFTLFMFVLPTVILFLIPEEIGLESFADLNYSIWEYSLFSILPALPYLAIFITMRRSNGYAGIHDLLSATRVTAVIRKDPLIQSTWKHPDLNPSKIHQVGPYEVIGEFASREDEAHLLGFDPQLRRKVWLHLQPITDEYPAPSTDYHIHHAQKIYWIHGGLQESSCWDVYGIPEGTPFGDWIKTSGTPDWEHFRVALLSLLRALNSFQDFDIPPRGYTLNNIWINAVGEVQFIDFMPGLSVIAESKAEYRSLDDWLLFTREFIQFVYEGKGSREELAIDTSQRPYPIYATAFLDKIVHKEDQLLSIEELISELEQLSSRDVRISRLRRIETILTVFALPIAVTAAMFSVGSPASIPFVLNLNFGMFSYLALPAVLIAFVARGGLLFGTADIAVVIKNGELASRMRCLCRSLVVWAPILLWTPDTLLPISYKWSIQYWLRGSTYNTVLYVVSALYVFTAVYAIFNTERGIPDRIVGTFLVPRAGRRGFLVTKVNHTKPRKV